MSTSKFSILSFVATVMLAGYMSTVTCQDDFLTRLKNFPCYKRKFVVQRFNCLNEFYLSFRENPFQSCSDKVVEMSQCRELVDKGCLSHEDPKSFMYRMYKRIRREPTKKGLVQEFCRNAGVFIPYLSKTTLKSVGCTVDYYVAKVNCMKDFQRKWRHNRGNKLLCKEHYAMDKCFDRVSVQHCTAASVKRKNKFSKDFMSPFALPYNPFCVRK